MCENKKRRNFACLYREISWHDLLQIWYIDSPGLGVSQQQIWLNPSKRSWSKLHSLSFLSLYSHSFLAAWHTTVCLDSIRLASSWRLRIYYLCFVFMPYGKLSACLRWCNDLLMCCHFYALTFFFNNLKHGKIQAWIYSLLYRTMA